MSTKNPVVKDSFTTQSPQAGDSLAGIVRALPEETYETGEGPKCPFCGTQMTADDPQYFDETGWEDDCSNCGNVIRIEPCVSTAWTTKPIRWANADVLATAGEQTPTTKTNE